MEVTIDQILDLEIGVWDALKSGDAERDRQFLAPNFLGVYETGFANRDEHCGQLDKGPTVSRYELSDARLLMLADDTVLLSYLATWVPLRDGAVGESKQMYVSSIWQRFGTDWTNVFSQDTIVASRS